MPKEQGKREVDGRQQTRTYHVGLRLAVMALGGEALALGSGGLEVGGNRARGHCGRVTE